MLSESRDPDRAEWSDWLLGFRWCDLGFLRFGRASPHRHCRHDPGRISEDNFGSVAPDWIRISHWSGALQWWGEQPDDLEQQHGRQQLCLGEIQWSNNDKQFQKQKPELEMFHITDSFFIVSIFYWPDWNPCKVQANPRCWQQILWWEFSDLSWSSSPPDPWCRHLPKPCYFWHKRKLPPSLDLQL